MGASQSRHKIYHDKRRNALEFKKGNRLFFRVTPVTGVGRALKSRKLTPCFIGSYQRYISDPSYMIQVNDVQVRDNLTIEASPVRIEDQEVKQLHDKKISLMKVAWGGSAGGNMT
ncbi:uncharacterized protein LOC131650332 [Vicia villosa]|uniref:uncharacterized protein LOC131650332 n=1 Tax=Vicia villosa TaxID=3911 RepID=UPI00273A7AAC|nr:uncharacterized protein LOC131650332 [Vicia villosa]